MGGISPLPSRPPITYVLGVFWFGRPPYLRWIAAAALVVGAALIEFRPTNTVAHPFTSVPVEAGQAPGVEWRMLPAGAVPPVSLDGMVASHQILAGEPITTSDLREPIAIPDGWWALALEVPTRLVPGTATRLVLADGAVVPGIVIASDESDSFGAPTALVAVPGEDVAVVAASTAARQVVVLIAP